MKAIMTKLWSIQWLQHLIFWVLSILFITSYFSISNEFAFTDLVYSLCFHLCLIPLVYILLRLIIPLLRIERYLLFILATVLNIGFGWIFHLFIFDVVVPNVLTSYYIVSFTEDSILLLIFGVYSLLAILLHFSKSWFVVNALEKDKITLELKSLKNQLNPHFLFNGLNGIYSLSLQNDKRAPEAILKLSDLLRYSLYEVSSDRVPVSKELEMIQNYIDIQLIRFKPNRDVKLTVNTTGSSDIAPMILLTLVENAFKHGNLTKDGSFIHVNCTYDNRYLDFECSNSISVNEEQQKNSSGIGLNSIQQLLDLYYEGKGLLDITQKEDIFTAKLKITFP